MTDIFLNGEIGDDSFDGSGESGIIGTKFIQAQLAKKPKDKSVLVHIDSPGGDVGAGYAIHDILKNSGREIHTIVEGKCHSIATVIFLAGKERTFAENSTFMIHNPWMITIGNADQLQEDVDILRAKEDDLLDFYNEKTGTDKETLEGLMAEEKPILAEDVLSLGFATNIAETIKGLKQPKKIFAKAYFNKTMKKKEESKSTMAMLDSYYDKFKAIFNAKHEDDDEDKNKDTKAKPRAEEQQLEDGTRIFINGDEGNFTGKEVWLIGEDGSLGDPLEDGDHRLGDGRTIRIGGGTISEVVEQMEEGGEDTNALKNQVAKLQAEVGRLKESQISDGLRRDLIGDLKNIKQSIQSEGTPIQGGGNFADPPLPSNRRSKIFDRAHKHWNKNNKPIKN